RRSRDRRPNLQAGCVPRRKFGQRQPGAALRFLQAPSAARRKNRLSARGLSRNRKKMPGKGCVPLERAGACTPKRPRSNAGLFLCPGRQEKRPAVKSRPPEEAGGAPKDEIGRARVGKECGGRGAAEEHKGKRGAGGDTQ